MKLKNSLCASGALMKETFRMYWYIPAVTFVLYFFLGIVPVLSNLSEQDIMSSYLIDSLNNMNGAYIFIMNFVPVITGVLMMGFLHKETKALMLHAQPLSKNRIFNSYYLTGWLMCVIPLFLMLVPYMALALKVQAVVWKDIAFWLFSSVAAMTLLYALTIFAGSLTGSTVMNLLATGVFMLILPILTIIADAYCMIFISGYNEMPQWVVNTAVRFNPIINMLFGDGTCGWGGYGIYLLIAIALSLFARLIYKTRKLERVGASTLSPVFEELMTYLLTFTGMSLLGLMMWTISDSKALMVMGMAVGAALTFFMVKVIINRSIRIWNKQFVRSMAVYFVIALIFIALTVLDITGFSGRVPELEDIEYVEMDDMVSGYYSGMANYGDSENSNVNCSRQFTSTEALELIIQLHQYIIDEDLNAGYYEDSEEGGIDFYGANGELLKQYNDFVHIKYKLKDGREIDRRYDIALDEKAAGILDRLLTSEEYYEKNSLKSCINLKKVDYVQIFDMNSDYQEDYSAADYGAEDYASGTALVSKPKEMEAIFEAYDEDLRNCGYLKNNRNIVGDPTAAIIEIYFKPSKAGATSKRYGQEEGESISFDVYRFDKNTMDYLISKGLLGSGNE